MHFNRSSIFVAAIAIYLSSNLSFGGIAAEGFASSDAPARSPTRNDPIGILQEQIIPRLSNLPGGAKLKALIDDYETVLGTKKYITPNVGGSNAGISSFLAEEKAKDFSLVMDASAFYAEIADKDLQRAALLKKEEDSAPLGKRSSLADRAGDSRSANVYPGWAWDLALKHAHGDPNRAVRLIGICGHDDVAQGPVGISGGGSSKAAEVKEKLQALRAVKIKSAAAGQASIRAMIEQVEQAPQTLGIRSSQKSQVLPELKSALSMAEIAAAAQLSQDVSEGEIPYICPKRTSMFYHPESLGKDFKVSDDLRSKIVWNQARGDYVKGDRRGEILPAKSYHMYGAALVSCEMIARGYPPKLVKYLQSWIAWAYRTQRMTSDLASFTNDNKSEGQKPWTELTEAEWEKRWKGQEKLGPMMKQSISDSVKWDLESIKSSFAMALEDPTKAPWKSEKLAAMGTRQDSIDNLEKAFERYKANPGQSPYNPPLSYEEFKAEGKKGRQAMAKKSGNEPGIEPENQRGAYRDYLVLVSLSQELWDKVPLKKQSNFTATLNPAMEAMGSGSSLNSYPNAAAYKRDQLERWNASTVFQNSIMRYSEMNDAAYLLRQTSLAGPREIAGKKFNLPYTDYGFPFPNSLRTPAFDQILGTKPEGWSSSRYERAKNKVDSWMADWEWTVAQHELGAEFAAKNCRPGQKSKGTPAGEVDTAAPETASQSAH